MLGFIKRLLDDNAREIKKLTKQVDRINSLEPELEKLSDHELSAKTGNLKKGLPAVSPWMIFAETFAVVRKLPSGFRLTPF